MEEVYRDHLQECFKHFSGRFNSFFPPRSSRRNEAISQMKNFCGAARQTIQRWVDGLSPIPEGIFWLKLMCYLDMHGYRIIEFERMPKAQRYTAEILGFGVLEVDAVKVCIQYGTTQHLYGVLRGDFGLGDGKENLMFSMWKENRAKLEIKKKESYEKFGIKVLLGAPKRPPSLLEVAPPVLSSEQAQVHPTNQVINSISILATLNILQSSIVLFEELLEGVGSDELSVFDQPILRLSSRLNELSSRIIQKKVI